MCVHACMSACVRGCADIEMNSMRLTPVQHYFSYITTTNTRGLKLTTFGFEIVRSAN